MAHQRSQVTVLDDVVVKTFESEEAAATEHFFYKHFCWATPKLLSFDGSVLTFERLRMATDDPGWRRVDELKELLVELWRSDVHHRDVHAKNLAIGRSGEPLLIDWETAVLWEGAPASYDLVGPEGSGVPKPVEHEGYSAQWWDSGATKFAMGRWWQ